MGSRMGVSGREHSTRGEAWNEVLQGNSVWVGSQPFSPGGSGARSGGLHGRARALAGGRAHDVTACGTHAPGARERCSRRSAARCALERALGNGTTGSVKILRDDIRMSRAEPGPSRSLCWAQTHAVGFLTPEPRVPALRSSSWEGRNQHVSGV